MMEGTGSLFKKLKLHMYCQVFLESKADVSLICHNDIHTKKIRFRMRVQSQSLAVV